LSAVEEWVFLCIATVEVGTIEVDTVRVEETKRLKEVEEQEENRLKKLRCNE
jgi:hypothetical protein